MYIVQATSDKGPISPQSEKYSNTLKSYDVTPKCNYEHEYLILLNYRF